LSPVIRITSKPSCFTARLRKKAAVSAALAFTLLAGSAAALNSAAQSAGSRFDELATQAEAARAANDWSRAIALYTQAEELNPQWADGWWQLGLLQFQSEAYPEARRALTRFLDLTTEKTGPAAQAVALRGLCAFEMGDYARSLGDLARGSELLTASDHETASYLHFREAQALTRLGRFDEALGVYTALARTADASPELKIGVGLAGLRAALLPADATASEQPMYAAAGDAALRWMKGDMSGGRQGFAEFFARYPATANAHYLFGLLLLAEDQAEAAAECRHELEIAPENADAAAFLAWVLLLEDHPDQALPIARKAAAEAPALPRAQLTLGRALAETGDTAAGIEHLEAALRLQPEDIETHAALAEAYSNAGRKADARRERMTSLEIAKASLAQR
jgi:tetratricopeptide (TPR) repeat protein